MNVICLLICVWVYIHSAGAVMKDYYWRDYSFGDIPYDAIEIANDGNYIGQAYFNDGLLPVTIYPNFGMAIGELFGKIVVKENIQILCSSEPTKLYWDLVDFKKPTGGQLKNSVVGGFYKTNLNYFIGKAYHEGEWKVSKVIPHENPWKALIVWDSAGKAFTFSQFHLLKYNSATSSGNVPTCSN